MRLYYRGHDLGQFYLLNLLKAVSALDRGRSLFNVYTTLDLAPQPIGSIKAIRRAVLDAAALVEAPPMFRLAEQHSWVLFSPELRAKIVEQLIGGFHFF